MVILRPLPAHSWVNDRCRHFFYCHIFKLCPLLCHRCGKLVQWSPPHTETEFMAFGAPIQKKRPSRGVRRLEICLFQKHGYPFSLSVCFCLSFFSNISENGAVWIERNDFPPSNYVRNA
ncbi:hypothetical protein CEXT_772341 [Caerostris extrusa]|uniref:Uncharacterized protein n=1 Tax=Caerostris extrusa TaxID=172846 RepID=A0AAV4VGM2_CAEEX|nr:hypothetical protein CEXT_772341 [Caerostris extrusa]